MSKQAVDYSPVLYVCTHVNVRIFIVLRQRAVTKKKNRSDF